MRHLRITLGVVIALALVASPAFGQSHRKVTGGGQIVLDSDDFQGAGDTIAFQAQETTQGRQDAPGVRGEVQYVGHLSGGKWHGRVTCIEIMGNMAVIGGVKTHNPGDTPDFEIFIEDNGPPPGGTQGEDMIIIDERDEEADCEADDDTPGQMSLGRGNVRIHSA